ncbi:hypothetical protein ACH42_04950 [Endozoicomonas sp. (ex Bugula neritina AB1)]|nr:hypothetical protein ACH42_04950 [Endozoicomonas sp. (ex Bugula neritina AB1)]
MGPILPAHQNQGSARVARQPAGSAQPWVRWKGRNVTVSRLPQRIFTTPQQLQPQFVPMRQRIATNVAVTPLMRRSQTPVYNNLAARFNITHERITARFAQPQQVANVLRQEAWTNYNTAHSFRGSNQALLAKAQHLGGAGKVIEHHHKAQEQIISKNPATLERQGRQIIDNLQNGINELTQLLNTQSHSMHGDEHHYLHNTRQTLKNELKLMIQVMEDKGATQFKGTLNIRQAMELKRLGYTLDTALKPHLSNLTDHQVIPGSEVGFGSGAIHSVVKLAYRQPDGTVKEKIFKAEDPLDPCPFDSITGTKNYLNKQKPRFAARNFAAAKLDKALNMGLLPKMEFTVHNGQMGILMDKAEGIKPLDQSTKQFSSVPVNDPKRPELSAKIQKNLNSAEWLDGICGQQDRHPGNLFIDPKTGDVTLIDNDMAFYPGQDTVRRPSQNPQFRKYSGSTAGLPPLIDKNVYDKLMKTETSHIRNNLEGLLTPKEIQATIKRMNQLKAHAKQLASQGKVIENWQTWRDPQTKLGAAKFQEYHGSHSYYLAVQGRGQGLVHV